MVGDYLLLSYSQSNHISMFIPSRIQHAAWVDLLVLGRPGGHPDHSHGCPVWKFALARLVGTLGGPGGLKGFHDHIFKGSILVDIALYHSKKCSS